MAIHRLDELPPGAESAGDVVCAGCANAQRVGDGAARIAIHAARRGLPEGAELDRWMAANCFDSQHAAGTCRMGPQSDPRSVVDPDCRVIGMDGLRVIDCSIMPEIVRSNTHLPVVMIAELMADRIRGKLPK